MCMYMCKLYNRSAAFSNLCYLFSDSNSMTQCRTYTTLIAPPMALPMQFNLEHPYWTKMFTIYSIVYSNILFSFATSELPTSPIYIPSLLHFKVYLPTISLSALVCRLWTCNESKYVFIIYWSYTASSSFQISSAYGKLQNSFRYKWNFLSV